MAVRLYVHRLKPPVRRRAARNVLWDDLVHSKLLQKLPQPPKRLPPPLQKVRLAGRRLEHVVPKLLEGQVVQIRLAQV